MYSVINSYKRLKCKNSTSALYIVVVALGEIVVKKWLSANSSKHYKRFIKYQNLTK